MTAPNDEPGFLLRMIIDKLDDLGRKVDGQSEKFVSYDFRVSALEKAEEERKTSKSSKWQYWGTVAVAVLAAVLAWVPDVFLK